MLSQFHDLTWGNHPLFNFLIYFIQNWILLVTKDKGYHGSLILGVIDVLVVQCQLRSFTDALYLLKAFWNKLVELSHLTYYRSSYPEVFLGKGVLKICSTFTGEHPRQSTISIKLLCRTPFPRNTSGWLLLILFAGYTCPKIDET